MKKQYKAVFSAAAIAAAAVITVCVCLLSVRGITAPAALLTLPAVTASDLFPSYAERCGLWFSSAKNPDVTFDNPGTEISQETVSAVRAAVTNITEPILQQTLQSLGIPEKHLSITDYSDSLVMNSKSDGTGFKLWHCNYHAFIGFKDSLEMGISVMLDHTALQPYIITLDDPYGTMITDADAAVKRCMSAFAKALGTQYYLLTNHGDMLDILSTKAAFYLPVCAGVVATSSYSLLSCKSLSLENRTVYLLGYSCEPVNSISVCALNREQMELLLN